MTTIGTQLYTSLGDNSVISISRQTRTYEIILPSPLAPTQGVSTRFAMLTFNEIYASNIRMSSLGLPLQTSQERKRSCACAASGQYYVTTSQRFEGVGTGELWYYLQLLILRMRAGHLLQYLWKSLETKLRRALMQKG